jgi:hypothetical protein
MFKRFLSQRTNSHFVTARPVDFRQLRTIAYLGLDHSECMRETKLGHHLLLLSERDRKDFARFLDSPYFNEQPNSAALFAVLDQHILRYKHRDLTEPEVFALLFPARPFDQNKLRKECTALLKLLLQFLAQQAYQLDAAHQSYYLLQQLYALGEDDYFPFHFQDIQAELQAAASKDGAYYDHQMAVGVTRFRFDLRHADRKSSVDLNELIDHAELAYCIKKMELLYAALNHGRVVAQAKEIHDPQFLDLVGRRLPHLPIQTQMYYHLFCCTIDPQAIQNYHAFRSLLFQSDLKGEYLLDMYTAAVNYCVRKSNAGNQENLIEIFGLYQEMLAQNLLTIKGVFPSPQFKNMVVIAGRLNEFDWIRSFMAKNSDLLPDETKSITIDFCLGVLCFMEGDLKRAEPAFNRVLDNFEDVFFGLDARGYLLRIYYETGNMIGLESLIDSFRMFLKRSRDLSAERKVAYGEFIRFVRRLVRTSPHDDLALRKLQDEIRLGAKVPVTGWLLEKVAQLLGE